jgi:hypothetical protein
MVRYTGGDYGQTKDLVASQGERNRETTLAGCSRAPRTINERDGQAGARDVYRRGAMILAIGILGLLVLVYMFFMWMKGWE